MQKKSWFDYIETIGNKIPNPLYLFMIFCLIIAVISAIMSGSGLNITHPVSHETVPIRNLISGEGLVYILQSTVTNFINFKPLGLVLCMMIAVGLVQEVKLADVAIKTLLLNAPRRFVTASIFLVGIVGNLASDAAFVLVPPLAGIIFAATKRNPVVGICAGFVAVAAGFTANIFIAGTDVLLSGVTNEASATINGAEITPAANWYFMLLSVPFLTIMGTWITEKLIEPRFPVEEDFGAKASDESQKYAVSDRDRRALKYTGLFALLFIALLVITIYPENSPLRGPSGGLVPSPFLSGMIPIIMTFFISCSIVFGVLAGTIQSFDDLPRLMTNALKNVGGYIVLVFFIAQFIGWFNWTNLSLWLAVSGADFLSSVELPSIVMLGALIILSGLVNLVVFSGSAQWAMMAPIFVPLLMLLGIEPDAIQMAYRIGDSTTNVISPTNPYLPMVLALIAQYNSRVKFGTFLSIMFPYSIILVTTWGALFLGYYALGLPLGPM
ncbi:p-aminobenzoyl-glutamate transporter [Ignatzschineria ureiclastica]|uniref:p-aminobenzoyl-glutamate transporter n=1 Tax=Ignatzschineria ureiclastica TaxID=472582 RepID=A0A2U2ACX7_9GAMM|nr:AbgT family transporter [Ignatzschineria ureiclastica]PWD80514.1 p-aminobenzoyl-glutamate transporter [Ignatzschineria ureiclastica]GGZ98891.1 aminobenzoyl-glutamate transporter [Ignatzschineria ureiclastica]